MNKTWHVAALIVLVNIMLTDHLHATDKMCARRLMEEAFNHRYRWDDTFRDSRPTSRLPLRATQFRVKFRLIPVDHTHMSRLPVIMQLSPDWLKR